ncbi:L-2-amino-thiazoline-4-carboxylic acid hydrolase [Streptomyces gardneri]|nr:L-2-amino-thiazoline-4-carboxylic acid hydrolase [Streptomyces gardneri]
MIPTDVTWFSTPFLAALAPLDEAAVVADAAGIVDDQRHTAVDKPALDILWFTALSVAAYRCLRHRNTQQEAIEQFRAAFLGPFYDWIRRDTETALDASGNPLDVLREGSKQRERDFFGGAFRFDHPQDDANGYIAVVRKCYYQQILIATDAAELLPTFCDFDTSWMDAASEERHGIRVERPTTFGYGGPSCWFVMTKLADTVRS